MNAQRLPLAGRPVSNGLYWVRAEIERSLSRVRAGLEHYLESGVEDDRRPLLDAVEDLMQVRGTVRMIECFGAAELADEMLQTLNALLGGRVDPPDAAFDALSGASLQLSDYIDLLANGEVDRVVVLQPAINELRLARHDTLRTEAALFAAQCESTGFTVEPPSAEGDDTLQTAAAAELTGFQARFLQWYRGNDASAALQGMGEVAARLSRSRGDVAERRLWWCLSLLVGSIADVPQDALELKRLIGRAGMRLRQLAERGEAVDPADATTAELLYHLARLPAPSASAATALAALAPGQLLPDDTVLRQIRSRLKLPNSGVLEQVHQEVRRDLQQVKDAIDLVVRTHGRAGGDLDLQRMRLQRLSNTLGVLGLDGASQVLANQARAVTGLEATAAGWMESATALLRVEHSLEEMLFRAQGRLRSGPARDYATIVNEIPPERDLQDAVRAMLRESLVDLSQIKDSVLACLDGSVSAGGVDTEIARLMAEIASGLHIIGRDRGAELVRKVSAQAAGEMLPASVRDARSADRLADAIACVELYLEALRDGLPDPDALLDRLDGCVSRLHVVEDTPAPAVTSPPTAPQADDVDPEIRDIFVDEAGEVLAALQRDLPRLHRAPQDQDTLTAVRRGFHTLKGSGRMVGAARIAELAWALEQVFNRCLDGALPVRTPVLEVADAAVALLPALVVQFRDDSVEPAGVDDLLAEAERVRTGDGGAVDMYQVFREDAQERLALVQRWLASQAGATGVDVEPEVVRAFHTLRGSAGVINAAPLQRIAHAFESYFTAVRLAGRALPAEALTLTADTVSAMQGWIGNTAFADVSDQDVDRRIRAIEALGASLPEPVAASTGEGTRRDAVTFDALDTLQTVESMLRDGSRPDNAADHPAARLRTLAGQVPETALSHPLSALADRVTDIAGVPSMLLNSALEDVFEDLYQRLDAYREGEPLDDPAPLLDRIAGLPLAPPSREGGMPPLPPAPSLDDEVTDIEAPFDLPGFDVADTPAIASDDDQELRDIFFAEARELMDDYAASLQAVASGTADGNTLTLLRRTLHTLKGSARMAGLTDIGDTAQQYEQHASALEEDPACADQERIPLAEGYDRLRAALLAAGAALATPAPVEATPAETGDVGEPEAPRPAPPMSFAAEPAIPSGVDAELTAVFADEAGELLEALDLGFDAWSEGDEENGLRDLRRALHTLKGSARVAGLDDMGNLVHLLETRVEMTAAGGHVDADALQPLRQDLEQLHLMHDALRRGETLPAVAPAAVSDVTATWSAALFWQPADEQVQDPLARREYARVPVDVLNGLLNLAGEVSIFRSRIEQHNAGLRGQLNEMTQTISRVRAQLRMMDIETEAQIAARGLAAGAEQAPDRYAQDFDPLEMDRYSRMQELSRALAEAVNDLSSLYGSLDQGVAEADNLLLQQGRIGTEVQQGLMGTLMVPFSRQQARLERVVRQTSLESGKRVELLFDGLGTELDRNVLERITAPLEHLLRNAVVHGIEAPEERRAAGKAEGGRIDVRLRREAEQLLIELADDGRGLDFAAIRAKAEAQGRLRADAEISQDDLARFIFEPGFSTAATITHDAGRGIGLDVVASSVRQLGGALELRSVHGEGTRFLVRLPLTLAVSQALLVGVGSEQYAVPLPSVIGVTRIPVSELADHLASDSESLDYGGQRYAVTHLGSFVDVPLPAEFEGRSVVTLLVRAGETLTGEERRVALVVDQLLGNRELISKAIGPQLSAVPGVAGASILADGRVVLMLDVPALVAERGRRDRLAQSAPTVAATRDTIMVVDDSITMRRVAERLLDRAGYRVVTARDGLDAIALLQTEEPVTVLLDIEMPRADGFEVAAFIRNNERLAETPIIMITSRSGEKHRERARALGVDRYLIKPYQEEQLLKEVEGVRRHDGASRQDG